MRWIMLVVIVAVLLVLGNWDLNNIAAAFAGGVLLADDVKAIWRRVA